MEQCSGYAAGICCRDMLQRREARHGDRFCRLCVGSRSTRVYALWVCTVRMIVRWVRHIE